MFHESSTPRSQRNPLAAEEQRAWLSFYGRVRHDAAIAAEVLIQLEADLEMKRTHLALYLCCKESIRLQKARLARNKRIGLFLRWMCRTCLLRPWQGLERRWHRGADLAVACLPEAAPEAARDKGRAPARSRPAVRSGGPTGLPASRRSEFPGADPAPRKSVVQQAA